MTTPRPRSRQPKQLDAGIVQAEIGSFALRLAAEDSSALDLFQREDRDGVIRPRIALVRSNRGR
jgi:hypothetical protein